MTIYLLLFDLELKKAFDLVLVNLSVTLCIQCNMMQTDRNSFYGDVALDSVAMTSRDAGTILDHIYEKHTCSNLYFDIIRKCMLTLLQATSGGV